MTLFGGYPIYSIVIDNVEGFNDSVSSSIFDFFSTLVSRLNSVIMNDSVMRKSGERS